jgi:hypothetical protein
MGQIPLYADAANLRQNSNNHRSRGLTPFFHTSTEFATMSSEMARLRNAAN